MSGGAGGRERRRNGWLPLPSNTVIENPALQAVPIALELREAIGASEPPRAGARRPRRLLPDQEVDRSHDRNGYQDGRNDAADEQLADVHFGSDARGGGLSSMGGGVNRQDVVEGGSAVCESCSRLTHRRDETQHHNSYFSHQPFDQLLAN